VDLQALLTAGVVPSAGLVKILANGDLTKALTVKVDKVSQGAKDRILAAGGTVEA
jgi:large subunit ribosomal protein L15